jgi:hypothetical protein
VRVPAQHASSDDIPTQLEGVTSVKERRRIFFLDDKGPLKEAQTEVLRWLRMRFGEGERIELTNVGVFVFSSPDQRR